MRSKIVPAVAAIAVSVGLASSALAAGVNAGVNVGPVGVNAGVNAGLNTNANINTGLNGQVQTNDFGGGATFLNKVVYKDLTLEPGAGQFGYDHLALGDRLVLTLINPTNNPLRFETSQRLGAEQAIVVPAHSQQTISYIYTNPVSDEVKFLVYQEPSSAVAANTDYFNQQQAAAAIPTVTQSQSSVSSDMSSQVNTSASSSQNVTQSRSTVRGFW